MVRVKGCYESICIAMLGGICLTLDVVSEMVHVGIATFNALPSHIQCFHCRRILNVRLTFPALDPNLEAKFGTAGSEVWRCRSGRNCRKRSLEP